MHKSAWNASFIGVTGCEWPPLSHIPPTCFMKKSHSTNMFHGEIIPRNLYFKTGPVPILTMVSFSNAPKSVKAATRASARKMQSRIDPWAITSGTRLVRAETPHLFARQGGARNQLSCSFSIRSIVFSRNH